MHMTTNTDDAETQGVRRASLASQPRVPAARLGVAVVRDLVESIVTGRVRPGENLLTEGLLSDEFAVSRTVIRESIKRVEEKGLVQVEQGRGTTVTPITQWNLLDPVVLGAMVENDDSLGILDEVISVRSALESEMAANAAIAMTEADVVRMRDSLQSMRDVIDDVLAFRRADVEFHSRIMEISRSRLGASIARMLTGDPVISSQRYHGNFGGTQFPETLVEHERILAALEANDSELARQMMRDHIETAWARRRLPVHRID
jgi:GntR family transcriptional regulator, galactonate operon transcriptional repressor